MMHTSSIKLFFCDSYNNKNNTDHKIIQQRDFVLSHKEGFNSRHLR